MNGVKTYIVPIEWEFSRGMDNSVCGPKRCEYC